MLLLLGLILCLMTSYGMRGQGILGPLVEARIAEVALKQGLEVRVEAMSPAGLTGLRLHGVHVAGTLNTRQVLIQAEEVDLYPSLSMLVRGQGVLAEVVVRRGGVWFGAMEASNVESGIDRESPGLARSALLEGLKIHGEEFFVEVDGDEFPIKPPGVDLESFSLELRVGTHSVEPLTFDAVAKLDDQRLRISLRERHWEGTRERELGRVLRVEGDGLDLSKWVHLPKGARLGLEQVDLCWDCLIDHRHVALILKGVKIGPSEEIAMAVRFRSVELEAVADQVDVRIATGSVWGLEGRQFLAEFEDIAVSIDRGLEQVDAQAVILDRAGGRADLDISWNRLDRKADFSLWFADFDAGLLGRISNSTMPLRDLRVGGAIRGHADLDFGLIQLRTRAELRALTLDLPFLAAEKLVFERTDLGAEALIHLPSRSISLTSGRVRFGAASPISFEALAVSTEPGWSFSGTMLGEDLDAALLLETLPLAMTGALREAQLEGNFDIGLKTSGMTAFPDSLVLDVTLGGEVEVRRDGHYVDLRALGSGAAPAFDSESHPARQFMASEWASYDSLPSYIPHALLSAEDAAFFKHSGLDWVGLRMAMVHNLREGSFARGGSTISQQLAKNLFLTPNRTLSRKLQEAFLTWRIEAELDKERILELYLNVVEWGPQVHGLYRASYYYFGVPPEELEVGEVVLLAAILPSPVRFGDSIKLGYLPSSRRGKMERTLVNMRFLNELSWSTYLQVQEELEVGKVGRIELLICADDDAA
ncbi:MAG: biosynthetic peptidoglycan transglycosylase, partial [Bradymonadaceae bacterium]